ncbi:MAG TPA: KamA family radical SAM protein [Pirellulales bacterium]|jgi:lysine 2,3-aminomutase|nr:KamA family radical SAM protein [Pirellulales bacterium]
MNEQDAGPAVASQIAVSTNGAITCEAEEPPGTEFSQDSGTKDSEPPSTIFAGTSAKLTTVRPPLRGPSLAGLRHPFWKDVPDDLWEDWRWQRQHAVRTTAQLAELLPLPPAEIAALERLESKYRTAIPPYYFSLIDPHDPDDPIRLQSVPSSREEVNISGVEFDDPLEEDKDSPVPGVTHRYPDRALLITTPVCSMYCRFCTRKRVTMDREGWDAPSRDEERMIEYVRDTHAIRDVIVSGGDPLTLPVAKLRWFVTQLAAIDHVDVVRIGTRVPVTLPQRLFDLDLVDLLADAGKIWIQTHFNHPTEITPEATRACRNLVNAGMPVSNHAVLMKGVNDSVETMRELVRGLLRIKVRPYYLFHCDPVTGAGHFRTSIWKGIEIIEGLRGHVSGLGVPTYVVDGLHGAGKIPVMPNYVLSASDDAVILRNYEGMIFRYAPEDKPVEAKPIESQGVSRVLSGDGRPIVPADTPRQARRRKNQESEADNQASVPAHMPPVATSDNGHAHSDLPSNGKLAGGKPANGKLVNGKTANGKANGKPAGNGTAARIVAALKIIDGVPIHSDHEIPGPANGNGKGNGHNKGNGHGSVAVKRRNGAANGKNGPNGSGAARPAKPIVHSEAPSLKNDLRCRPPRRSEITARKASGKASKKA